MRNHFDEQLRVLDNELITMGALCEEAIENAIKYLTVNESTLLQTVHAIDDQIDHRAVRADRRHGVRPSEPADDDEVGGVERDLQHGREHQRQDKLQKLRQERPFCHIDLISFFHLPTSAQTTYKIRCI